MPNLQRYPEQLSPIKHKSDIQDYKLDIQHYKLDTQDYNLENVLFSTVVSLHK